jgi:hypothetical protein
MVRKTRLNGPDRTFHLEVSTDGNRKHWCIKRLPLDLSDPTSELHGTTSIDNNKEVLHPPAQGWKNCSDTEHKNKSNPTLQCDCESVYVFNFVDFDAITNEELELEGMQPVLQEEPDGEEPVSKMAKVSPGTAMPESLISNTDQNVQVSIGGEVLCHNQWFLTQISGCFEGAINSSCRESKTKRFDMSHFNRDDWDLFIKIALPFSRERINRDNVMQILPIVNELCVDLALEDCDRTIANSLTECLPKIISTEMSTVFNSTSHLNDMKKDAAHLADMLDLSTAMKLPLTRQCCMMKLKKTLEFAPYLIDHPAMTKIVSCTSEVDAKEIFWADHLATHAPVLVLDDKASSSVMASLVCSGIKISQIQNRVNHYAATKADVAQMLEDDFAVRKY